MKEFYIVVNYTHAFYFFNKLNSLRAGAVLYTEFLCTAHRLRPRTVYLTGKVIFPMNLGSGEIFFFSKINNGVEPDVYTCGSISERLIKY